MSFCGCGPPWDGGGGGGGGGGVVVDVDDADVDDTAPAVDVDDVPAPMAAVVDDTCGGGGVDGSSVSARTGTSSSVCMSNKYNNPTPHTGARFHRDNDDGIISCLLLCCCCTIWSNYRHPSLLLLQYDDIYCSLSFVCLLYS